jgi:hypothetical protein
MLKLIGLIISLFMIEASAADKVKLISFPKASETKVIKESIKGYDGVIYTFTGKRAQKVRIMLKTSHKATYFNFLPAGSYNAIFNGSLDGNTYTGYLPDSGSYSVQVYMMRSAARRNEVANYSLSLSLTNDPNPPKQTIFPAAPRYYDASAPLPCSTTPSSFDMTCEGIVIRDYTNRSAKFWIRSPMDASYSRARAFSYTNGVFEHGENKKLTVDRKGDESYLNLEGKMFYKIPDAFVLGG